MQIYLWFYVIVNNDAIVGIVIMYTNDITYGTMFVIIYLFICLFVLLKMN